jgi:hypothetical protein
MTAGGISNQKGTLCTSAGAGGQSADYNAEAVLEEGSVV